MVPGLLGLVVAIEAFWCHQCLRQRLDTLNLEMQTIAVGLLDSVQILH